MERLSLATALRLGRVSNIPTVWTNVLTGMVLAGGLTNFGTLGLAVVSGSALYVGGMFLNDAFDADVDARERSDRPIPRGEVGRSTVFRVGFGLLGFGVAVLAMGAALRWLPWAASGASLATAGCVVAYDRWHKGNPAAPFLMGLCRVGLYALGTLCVRDQPTLAISAAAAALLAYVTGITYVARFETGTTMRVRWPLALLYAPIAVFGALGSWLGAAVALGFLAWTGRARALIRLGGPSIGQGVVTLIAGISLVDAVFLARFDTSACLLAIGAFGLTHVLQRHVPGT